MWEGLARTQRQDRALHGVAKLVNLVIGLIALPVWLIGQAVGERMRNAFTWLEKRKPRELPVPPERERSMGALMDDLREIPEHLEEHRVNDLRMGMRDISNFVLAQSREGAVLGYNYPAQFGDHIFEGADGERIAATIALQEAARPGLIVVHGVFTTSRFDYVRRIAVKAFYEWGFNVAVIDLRSFGLTEITSSAPSTAGWKEGLDLIALAQYMKQLGSTSVGALGISLGGSSVLDASDPEGAGTALDGGLLAVSPPADPKEVWGRLSEPVPRSHSRYPIHKAFKAALTSRVRSGRWPAEAEDMPNVMEAISAPYYEVSADEIWSNAAGTGHVGGAKVPLLIIHPDDDPIIKVEEAEKLAIAAAGNDLVRVWTVPHGSHGLLEAADPVWTNAVYREFFERWAVYAERGAVADRANGKLVYSEE